MNLFKKIYCRTYQTVFKLAIPILPYRDPEILDSILKIPEVLKRKKKDSVLIVTDKSIHSLGLIDPLKKALNEENISYTVYDEVVPNPTIKNVEEARGIYIEKSCNALIGFGGGSAIDCAKAVGARIVRPKKEIAKMKGILKIGKKLPFTIGVPTTAGTGSETTVTTVITDDVTRHKFPISDLVVIPDVAVHDPELTKSLPKHIAATTGMDVLTHAIEAYIGRSTVKETRADALTAARLVAENLEIICENSDNRDGRANMLRASYLAGRAFSKSYVGYCHGVAHALGGKYNIPHGLANAVLLPYVLESYGSVINKKLKDIAIAMHIADEETPSHKAAEILINKIKEMNRNLGIPTKLKGICAEDIPELAGYAEKESNPLYPVPVLMTAKELEKFFYDVKEVKNDKKRNSENSGKSKEVLRVIRHPADKKQNRVS